MNIEKLTVADFDELLDTMNVCFSHGQEGYSFLDTLPAMWRHDNVVMGRHLAIKDGSRVAAAVGVYPLPTRVAGHNIMFATVGNVATRPEYRKKGYMKTLMTESMEELKRIGADVARLGGLRQRYNRYGFEKAGQSINFTISAKNVRDYYDSSLGHEREYTPMMSFRPIERGDNAALSFAQTAYANALQHTDRGDNQRFYDVTHAWKCTPWLAMFPDGSPAGFLSTYPNSGRVTEHYAYTPAIEYQMLLDFLSFKQLDSVSFSTASWDVELNRIAGRIAESVNVTTADNFKVIHFAKLANAALAQKATYAAIPDGLFTLSIVGGETIQFKDGSFQNVDGVPSELTLNNLDATRFLFGPLPPCSICNIPAKIRPVVEALLPLPLWWNYQDRV
ncbi:MAG: GNAT family N-acetyltransferase [Victivallales bacterium]|nr:GNAT family N-acetyltransferase [Victivallales bacterium]